MHIELTERKLDIGLQNVTTQPGHHRIDPTLLDFIKTKANSFVKWELIRWFNQNPYTTDTAENIARYLGRARPVIKSALDDLVDDGILKREGRNRDYIYSLTRDQRMRTLADRFALAFENRFFRIEAVELILPGMR